MPAFLANSALTRLDHCRLAIVPAVPLRTARSNRPSADGVPRKAEVLMAPADSPTRVTGVLTERGGVGSQPPQRGDLVDQPVVHAERVVAAQRAEVQPAERADAVAAGCARGGLPVLRFCVPPVMRLPAAVLSARGVQGECFQEDGADVGGVGCGEDASAGDAGDLLEWAFVDVGADSDDHDVDRAFRVFELA